LDDRERRVASDVLRFGCNATGTRDDYTRRTGRLHGRNGGLHRTGQGGQQEAAAVHCSITLSALRAGFNL